MGRTSFDWRWIVLIFVALIFLGQVNLRFSPAVGVVLLAVGAYWAITAGLSAWRDRGPLLGSSKVTYWRGQRIELPRNDSLGRRLRLRTPAGTSLLISVFYLALGAGFVYAAVRSLLRLLVG
ncbi:MAG TPA: hypothetical protein VEZ12_04935 [Herpetosiphonaceae bacterium]|nr:hypothetical protein [Herpetosiphonaceae bacterium]